MGLSIESSGSFNNTRAFLDGIINNTEYNRIDALCEQGVAALSAATPQESGLTSQSWSYEIEQDGDNYTIWWINTHREGGFSVAAGLQYGHATGNGGWVPGLDYVNPAIKPVMDQIAAKIWKEVVT